MVEQAALLTDWIAPTVATETGAGRVQFTIVPSGAIILIGRMAPSFQTMSKQSRGNNGANRPPSEAHFEQLTLYFDCGEDPVKSKVKESSCFVMVSKTLLISPLTSKYCRDCQRPFGSSRKRSRSRASDCSINVRHAPLTVSEPYLSSSASIRSRA